MFPTLFQYVFYFLLFSIFHISLAPATQSLNLPLLHISILFLMSNTTSCDLIVYL